MTSTTPSGPERRASSWRPLLPVPADAPAPHSFAHPYRGDPEEVYEYRFDGDLLGYVCRFVTSAGTDEFLPLTWCVDDHDGTRRWHWKLWADPRPLFVAGGELAEDKGVPVVVVGNERHALRGQELLGEEFDFVTWPGQAGSWAKCMWSWLSGRDVYLWPDCQGKRERLSQRELEAGLDARVKPLLPHAKQPGYAAMVGIGDLLWTRHGCKVHFCLHPDPGRKPDGWGLADAAAKGAGAEVLRQIIRGGREFVPQDAAARAHGAIVPPAAAGQPCDSQAWRAKLLLTKTGTIATVRENAVLALAGDNARGIASPAATDGLIAFNELTNNVVKLRDAPWGTPAGAWSEVDDLLMGEWLVRELALPSLSRATLEEAVRVVAARRRFHPLRDWLQGLRWSGQELLSSWLRRACLDEDEWDDRDPLQRYLALVGTFFIMAMVARVMTPGVKFDYMLILEGAQGMRKSTLLRVLAGDEFFADTGLILGEKDSYLALHGGVWLYELPELDSFNRADVQKIKAYVASQWDYFRAPFDRRPARYPRQLVFAGTTNDHHYLTDLTGNRRFWPVAVTRLIDTDWVQAHREQLFAEALVRLQAGGRIYPTADEERELFVPQQELRAADNAIESAVVRYLYDPNQKVLGNGENGTLVDSITLIDLLARIGIGLEKIGPGRFYEKQVGAVLRKLGWIETRPRTADGPRPRMYCRPSSSSSTGAAPASSDPPGAGDQPARGQP